MDNKALAEMYVDLWNYIDGHFESKSGQMQETEVVNMVFEQTCKRIISDLIGKQRQGVPSKQEQSSGQEPSEKQISFAKKLGCKNPEGYSRTALSAWIEEHKEW